MRIKEFRERKGLQQKELAQMLGIAANTLSQYETGKREPDVDTLKRIADCLQVSVDELLGGKGQKETPGRGAGRSEDDIKFALFGGGGDITDAMYEEVKQFAQMVKLREENKKKKE